MTLSTQQSLPPEKQTLRSYDINSQIFAARYESAQHGTLINHIMTVFHPDQRVISLGCGSGKLEAELLSKGIDIRATDGSEEMLKQAISNHPSLGGRMSQLILPGSFPYDDGGVDGILAITVLMHLQPKQIDLVVSEMARCLVLGGHAYVSLIPERPDLNDLGFDPEGRFYNRLTLNDLTPIFADHSLVLTDNRPDMDALGQGVKVELGVFRRIRKPSFKH